MIHSIEELSRRLFKILDVIWEHRDANAESLFPENEKPEETVRIVQMEEARYKRLVKAECLLTTIERIIQQPNTEE